VLRERLREWSTAASSYFGHRHAATEKQHVCELLAQRSVRRVGGHLYVRHRFYVVVDHRQLCSFDRHVLECPASFEVDADRLAAGQNASHRSRSEMDRHVAGGPCGVADVCRLAELEVIHTGHEVGHRRRGNQ
jgi:hypothetical protein